MLMKKIIFLFNCETSIKIIFIFLLTKLRNIFMKGKIIKHKRNHQQNISTKKITNDYFSSHAYNFYELMKKKEKDFSYLEIGSFEGNSAIFVAKNFPQSKVTCIDPWIKTEEYADSLNFEDVEKNFDENVSEFNNIIKIKNTSDLFFQDNQETYDVIYVDGYHYGPQVFKDVENSWNILNKNGFLICDDYIWEYYKKKEETPCFAINSFLKKTNGKYSVVKVSNSQVFIKKIN